MTEDDGSRFVIFRPPWFAIAAFAVLSGVLTGLAGPFGMALMQPNVLARIAHFVSVALAMTVLTIGAAELVGRLAPRFGLWALALGAVLAALPGVIIVQASLRLFSPASLERSSALALLSETLLMNVVLALLGWRVLGGEFQARRMADIATEAGPGLTRRLPPELRSAPILALQAEDHYLRVHTQRGEALIHMRLGDAIMLLTGEDGVCPHRSFWVARRGLSRVDRKAGKVSLVLINGVTAPVSRARARAVDEWLARAPAAEAAIKAS